jgi:hypothetical protein
VCHFILGLLFISSQPACSDLHYKSYNYRYTSYNEKDNKLTSPVLVGITDFFLASYSEKANKLAYFAGRQKYYIGCVLKLYCFKFSYAEYINSFVAMHWYFRCPPINLNILGDQHLWRIVKLYVFVSITLAYLWIKLFKSWVEYPWAVIRPTEMKILFLHSKTNLQVINSNYLSC